MALTPRATQETVLQDFAQRLRRLREARHLRQLDMEELGLSYKYYRPFRPFSKRFVRNGTKPCIHPRGEAQQLQNARL